MSSYLYDVTTHPMHIQYFSTCAQRLESEKEQLERDLSFKADQGQQYDSLMESLRENNRQLQVRVSGSTKIKKAKKGSKSLAG